MPSTRLNGNVGYARPIALALSRPRLLYHALRLGVEALRSFFYPQFENALLRRRPVVNVDHPLDAGIPFDHRYIKKYLEFVELWMASFFRFRQLYGAEALPGMISFLDSIRRLYAEAGSVYLRVHTTTTRPSKNYNLRFALIHAADPHLNCVPSLHVMLVVANWILASELVGKLGADRARGFSRDAVERWVRELRGEAIAITESVLFVKQHSVNCIGASLYYLKARYPGFGDEEAAAFVRDLFAGAAGLLPDAQALRGVMLEVCDSMERAYGARPEAGWRAPILDFIHGFRPGTGAPTPPAS
jgi:hypothetical protein